MRRISGIGPYVRSRFHKMSTAIHISCCGAFNPVISLTIPAKVLCSFLSCFSCVGSYRVSNLDGIDPFHFFTIGYVFHVTIKLPIVVAPLRPLDAILECNRNYSSRIVAPSLPVTQTGAIGPIAVSKRAQHMTGRGES